jgi:hypothetical protein
VVVKAVDFDSSLNHGNSCDNYDACVPVELLIAFARVASRGEA